MSSNNNDGAANTPAASQNASSADATASTAAAIVAPEVNTEVPECKNEAHVKILEELMGLYFDYTLEQAEYKRRLDLWEDLRDHADADQVWSAYGAMDALIGKIEGICRMAKKANPELHMIKQYYREKAKPVYRHYRHYSVPVEEEEEPEVVEEEIN
ncbi:hypothetical protein PSEUBRA_002029 [Kalmanozyma brasiliensis GHG001]|uniref:uncharacterized protein n=1 Tax=Kalmanozyma brasiliensis (strain GHG001) TaxID=1365824 RepID=UPI001CE85B3F|nr:uncharacterized protein PSEUBRA_002029 [Kalmanozyma brasiliensis GHG001]KAF6767030.1 hypothetical protein PSEUBRA_002029 [Kalmanozyma brasiliensis GHG001]